MTKEQTIELIKEYKVAKVEFPNNLQEQALDMAIKALEQQPSDDCVSRQEVFETFGELLGVWGIKALMEMKPVTPAFPKCATNGDMIKAMFPNELLTSIISTLWWGDNMSFNKEWWNAPYKGVKE